MDVIKITALSRADYSTQRIFLVCVPVTV